jgi:hypothetical protein
MRTIYVPATAFLLLAASLIAFALSSASSLPPTVATHFSGPGHPDRWMSASGYIRFIICFGVGLPLFIVAVFYALRWVPSSLINFPRKDFWLADERLPETRRYFFRRGLWLGCMMLLLMICLHYTIVRANQVTPPQLVPKHAFGLMIMFLVALAFWFITFLRHFTRAESSTSHLAQQS